MFRPTDPQMSLLECQFLLPDEKRARLEKSWAHPFQQKILPMIDEEIFRDCFDPTMGRPNVPVKLLVGLHLLKEWEDLTDQQVLDNLEFNLQWHYALSIESGTAHLCQRTLHSFRVMLMKNDRAQSMFETITLALAEEDGIDLGRQRLDSTHVMSAIATLTRLGLFVQTITHFCKELRRFSPTLFGTLPGGYQKRYLEREGEYSDAKREQVQRRLPVVASDVHALVVTYADHPEVSKLDSYLLMKRLFEEQCIVTRGDAPSQVPFLVEAPSAQDMGQVVENQPAAAQDAPTETGVRFPDGMPADETNAAQRESEPTETDTAPSESPEDEAAAPVDEAPTQAGEATVLLKEPNEISSGSLQSPHDPDATYGHKGKGYEAQIVETCSEDNPYQLITGVEINGANESDQRATIPMLDHIEHSGLGAKEVLADTGYGSGKNIVEAAERGINLLAPVKAVKDPDSDERWSRPAAEVKPTADLDDPPPSREAPTADLASFVFDATFSTLIACPAGMQPSVHRLDEPAMMFWVEFPASACDTCTLAASCCTKRKVNGDRYLKIGRARVATEHRQREQRTDDFRRRYRKRSGIEATNAEIKGRHGADSLRVRGRARVRLAMLLKALAVNVKRALNHQVNLIRQVVQADRTAEMAV